MPVVIVLGSYGEFVGQHIARSALSRPGVTTKILVRRGAEADPVKGPKIADLVALGAEVVYGDASDPSSLVEAFQGVEVVISALGGWGDVDVFHHNVYEACKEVGTLTRIVPAQFGVDILSLPPEEMDDYMRKKRAWNLEGIACGIPYTIVSQGIFMQWLLTMPNNPFIHHDTGIIEYCEDPDVRGCVTTSLEDTARFTVDVALDPNMANRRVSILGDQLSANQIASVLSSATGKEYSVVRRRTLEEIRVARAAGGQTKEDAFNDYIIENWARLSFTAGFGEPHLVDVPAAYGWNPETFHQAAHRLLHRA